MKRARVSGQGLAVLRVSTIRRASRRVAGAVALAVAAMAGPIGAAQAQSLADTLVTAYRNSPDLASARASIRVAGENAVQARASGRPQVEGSVSLTADWTEFDEVVFPTTLALTVTQAVYTGGQIANATRAAETRITAEEATLGAIEQQVLLDALTAHVDILRDEAFVELGIKNLRVLSEQLRAAQERFEVGEVTRTDVEQARAAVAASRSSLAAARGSLVASRESYRRVVGRTAGDLDSPPPLPEIPATVEEAVAIALVSDPNLQSARLSREAAGFDVRSAIGALLPQVALQGSLSRTDTLGDRDFGGNPVDGVGRATVGVSVTLPFYSGGANYSNIRESQALVDGAIASITTAERTAVENVGVSYSSLQVAIASIEAGQLEVEAARLAFEGVQEEAKVGARTTLDVLDAEADVLEAESDLVASRRDETVAVYSVLASIGLLTIDHLGLDIAPNDASEYYASVRDRYIGYDASEDTVWTKRWRP
ncbi:MAG: TolC family outer membrane protein [Pseudomonadota bacterium]